MSDLGSVTDCLLELANEHLLVRIQRDGSAEVVDRSSERRWRMGHFAPQEEGPIDVGHCWQRMERSPCEQYVARFEVTALDADGTLRYTVLGREREPQGSVVCRMRLDGPWWEVTLLTVDDRLPSLVFPPSLDADSLVVPEGAGRLIRRPVPVPRYLPPYSGINQRWFGGLRGDAGWLAVLAEGHDDAGVMLAGLSAAPAWLQSMGRWDAQRRSVRYRFTTGGYAGLARAYRAWAEGAGLVRTLAEKIAEVPAVDFLRGGRIRSYRLAMPQRGDWWEGRHEQVPAAVRPQLGSIDVGATYADVARSLAAERATAPMRGVVNLRGWIPGGYDDSHPDVWPPEPSLGDPAELRRLCQQDAPLVAALHDNYMDIYRQSPSFPGGVIERADGTRMTGGVWAGGQAYLLEAAAGLAYAERNWPAIAAGAAPGAMFIDTTTAVQLYESYRAGGRQTRADDEKYKRELLAFYKRHGLVLGSEGGADFGLASVDWVENRHSRLAGETVPLWSLAFHDTVFGARYRGQLAYESLDQGAPAWLTDALWGNLLLVEPLEPAFPGDAERVVDAWHERIGTAAMVDHRFLTEDHQVERTEFDTGDAIVVNFAAEPRTVDGMTLDAYSVRTLD